MQARDGRTDVADEVGVETQEADDLTPATARRRLGQGLRAAREAAGLSGPVAAAAIQRSSPTLSRLENGQATPRVVDVRALLDFYAAKNPEAVANGMRERLVALALRARRPEWFKSFNDVLIGPMTNDDSKRYVEYENDAVVIDTYEPLLIPGLLQTQAYAEAVTDLIFPNSESEDRRRFVEFRMARQRVLSRRPKPLRFAAVIGEAAIRRPIGGAGVMQEQIQHLLGEVTGGRAHVTVSIAPGTLNTRAVLGGPYVLMDLSDDEALVYLEGTGVSQYRQGEQDIAYYRVLARELHDAVKDAADSEAILRGVLREFV